MSVNIGAPTAVLVYYNVCLPETGLARKRPRRWNTMRDRNVTMLSARGLPTNTNARKRVTHTLATAATNNARRTMECSGRRETLLASRNSTAADRGFPPFVDESFTMRVALVATLLLLLFVGCNRRRGSSSYSVEDARSRGILVTEYAVADGAKLGHYTPLEVWIEDDRKLVVRLKGPHVDREPRVNIQGLTDLDYRAIWSERDGPPYEVWLAPDPIPDTLVLQREEESIIIHSRKE
ncbi:hypothetical protein [Allorhodopirellula heiligendammensis]|uniref:hypothetical protein n=1 Tax=Allorhodopirellula heiligendammensis TaxID=2714739 RepID=UPI0011B78294|nr:hypothetical protein [Allorhodopirellula heiligendammensis]